jgi:hypothetical protein
MDLSEAQTEILVGGSGFGQNWPLEPNKLYSHTTLNLSLSVET